jgi:hypothetical protein
MGDSLYNIGLSKYKNLHTDSEFILIATGPTLDRFHKFPKYEKCIKVGVNKIYNNPLINEIDYYFFGSDYYINGEHRTKIDDLPQELSKFSSVYRDGKETGLGNINREDSDRLGCTPFECCLDKFPDDQSEDKLLGHSIVFPAIQMILYMGASKIYLVGCDLDGHSTELPYWWGEFKKWKELKYPQVEIVVINPVGLSGIFNEYTEI